MSELEGVEKARHNSMVNSLVGQKGLTKSQAEAAARKFFSKHTAKKKKKSK